jgi:hypothetical protein
MIKKEVIKRVGIKSGKKKKKIKMLREKLEEKIN